MKSWLRCFFLGWMLLLISNSSSFNIQHPWRYDSMPLICGVSRVAKFLVPQGRLSWNPTLLPQICNGSYFFEGVNACWKQNLIYTCLQHKMYTSYVYIILYTYIYIYIIYVHLHTTSHYRYIYLIWSYMYNTFMSHDSSYVFTPQPCLFHFNKNM